MKILFSNAKILTMENSSLLEGHFLLVDGSKISYIGKDKPKVFDREIDCGNHILMPGLKNAHTHQAMVFLKGYAEGLPLDQWLQQVFKKEDKLKEGDVYHLTKKAIIECLEGGQTSFFDMYFFPPMIEKAAKEMGIKANIMFTPGENGERLESFENIFEEKDSMIIRSIGFHAEYTANEEMLKKLSEFTHRHKLPVYTHISETKKEHEECISRHGLTPTQYLDSLGLFDYGGGGYHCIYLDEKDIEIFKRKNLNIVSCPGSNKKLNDGVAPLDRYLKEGINVALGTDGASSNYSLSMWKELRLAKENCPSLSDFDLLQMATVNGARAMGFDDSSYLKEGMKADFILVKAKSINELVDQVADEDVKLVMIDGKIPSYNKKAILEMADMVTNQLLEE